VVDDVIGCARSVMGTTFGNSAMARRSRLIIATDHDMRAVFASFLETDRTRGEGRIGRCQFPQWAMQYRPRPFDPMGGGCSAAPTGRSVGNADNHRFGHRGHTAQST